MLPNDLGSNILSIYISPCIDVVTHLYDFVTLAGCILFIANPDTQALALSQSALTINIHRYIDEKQYKQESRLTTNIASLSDQGISLHCWPLYTYTAFV